MNYFVEKIMDLLVEIKERHSPRSFLSKPIEEEKLYIIFEAARWSESSFNSQPWRYFLADKYTNEPFYKTILGTLSDFNKKWASFAPVLIAVACNKIYEHNNKLNVSAWYDCGLSSQNLVIQAMNLGISAHIIGGFDKNKLALELNLPESTELISVIALGYEGSIELLPDDIKKVETDKQRIRKKSDEIIFNKPL